MSHIGIKLQKLRQSRRLTQQEVADRLKITRGTVSNYEIGRRTPHLKELQRFANFYGVGLEYFDVTTKDDAYDLLNRAKEVFNSPKISYIEKEQLYRELLKLYLNIKG